MIAVVVVVGMFLALFAWSLCKTAGDADARMDEITKRETMR